MVGLLGFLAVSVFLCETSGTINVLGEHMGREVFRDREVDRARMSYRPTKILEPNEAITLSSNRQLP